MKPLHLRTRRTARRGGRGRHPATPGARFIAGGTNLLDLMKLQIEAPDAPDRRERAGPRPDRARRRTAACASARWCATPLWPPTSACGATMACCPAPCWPALRGNCATRRPRRATCCSARAAPTSTTPTSPATSASLAAAAAAIGGVSRQLAVIGSSDACIATHPSDMAVAMRVLDAGGGDGAGRRRPVRSIPIAEFHRCPATRPQRRDGTLEPGELITAVTLPPSGGGAQIYRKVRDRASYAFALVSVAAVVQPDGTGRVALGGVAHKPWRWRRPRPRCRAAQGELMPATCWPARRPTHDNAFQG